MQSSTQQIPGVFGGVMLVTKVSHVAARQLLGGSARSTCTNHESKVVQSVGRLCNGVCADLWAGKHSIT